MKAAAPTQQTRSQTPSDDPVAASRPPAPIAKITLEIEIAFGATRRRASNAAIRWKTLRSRLASGRRSAWTGAVSLIADVP